MVNSVGQHIFVAVWLRSETPRQNSTCSLDETSKCTVDGIESLLFGQIFNDIILAL